MKRTVLAVVVVATLVLTVGTVFAAGGTKVCVPAKEGKPIRTPQGGVCKTGYTLIELGAEGKEGPAGKEGKEGKEGPKGEKGATGSSGFAAAVTAAGSVLNGKVTVSHPSTGKYEIHWAVGTFPVCASSAETPDTVVTPLSEGNAVMADAVDICKAGEPDITVTIFSNAGVPTDNGFALISLLGS
jgi:hypothetical protein